MLVCAHRIATHPTRYIVSEQARIHTHTRAHAYRSAHASHIAVTALSEPIAAAERLCSGVGGAGWFAALCGHSCWEQQVSGALSMQSEELLK